MNGMEMADDRSERGGLKKNQRRDGNEMYV